MIQILQINFLTLPMFSDCEDPRNVWSHFCEFDEDEVSETGFFSQEFLTPPRPGENPDLGDAVGFHDVEFRSN